jgi:hypothetical protein
MKPLKLKQYSQGGTVSEIYEQQTGKPWATAKTEGLTDGSYTKNIELRSKLLSKAITTTKEPVVKPLSNPFYNPQEDYVSWDKKQQDINRINQLPQDQRIIEYQNRNPSKTNYAIVDKKKSTMSIYSPGSSTPLYTEPVDIGATKTDAQTVTKVNVTNTQDLINIQRKLGIIDDGIFGNQTKKAILEYNIKNPTNKIGYTPKYETNWDMGNSATGAGVFTISNIDKKGYKNQPILNMMNEAQKANFLKTGIINNVSTSLHEGYNPKDDEYEYAGRPSAKYKKVGDKWLINLGKETNEQFVPMNDPSGMRSSVLNKEATRADRISNGCVRCSKPLLEKLSSNLSTGSPIYILPEDAGNQFVYENNKINLKVGNTKDYTQYQAYDGSIQKGQGINRSQSLNYVPIKIESKYELGYPMVDTEGNAVKGKGNDNAKQMAKALEDNKKSLMIDLGINGDIYNNLSLLSLGIAQQESKFGDSSKFKLKNEVTQDVGKFLANDSSYNSKGLHQIKYDGLNIDVKQKLADYGITKSNLDDPSKSAIAQIIIMANAYKYEIPQLLKINPNIDPYDMLLYLNQGKRRELTNKTATPEQNDYIQNVKRNIRNFELKQKNER